MNSSTYIDRKFCVAPMLDWTVLHCRNFHRMLSKHAVLYTEMVTTGAIIHGDRDRHLKFKPNEHPVAVQLGGSNPTDLAQCASICEQYGYDEVNLNIGCPSDRVQSGRFGACLMADPKLVAECVRSMMKACSIPVTVKCRIGIDNQDEYEDLGNFVATVSDTGCRTFIVHARKAWLQGLSPKENRDIPPLNYERVYQLKQQFPELEIIINGGISKLDDCSEHLKHVDGVMMGREAYQNPYVLALVDSLFYNTKNAIPTRGDIVEKLIEYIEVEMANGAQLKHISRHILGLFQGVPGAKQWRRFLSQNSFKEGATSAVVKEAYELVDAYSENSVIL